MIKGLGGVFIGDMNFATEIVPLHSTSFTLEQSVNNYGYSYISSSEKMLVPAIDSYQARDKSWTIELDLGTIQDATYDFIRNLELSNVQENSFQTFICRGSDVANLVLESGTQIVSIFNNTREQPMTQQATIVDVLDYTFNGTQISVSPQVETDILQVAIIGQSETRGVPLIQNQVLSFSGLVFNPSGDAMLVYASEVQVARFPRLNLGQQSITFNVLKQIQIFKLS